MRAIAGARAQETGRPDPPRRPACLIRILHSEIRSEASMAAAETRMDERDWGLLVLLSVLWGGSFFFTGVAVRELPPFTIVLARVAIAAVLLLPVLLAHGAKGLPASPSCWLPV